MDNFSKCPINEKSLGMVTPLAKDIYKPILSELEKLGITARRTVSSQY